MKIELDDVWRRYGSGAGAVDAVAGVSLDVEDGELFVLLGPSGCGKSTLLELCAGLQRPTSGEIRFDDHVVAAPDRGIFVSPKQRDVAMVFQSYALYPHKNVFENIAFPLRVARQKRQVIEDAVYETAAMLDIDDLLDRRPAALSGGERQRVAIARALVREPSVFLLDEPLSNLDARLRTGMRAELKQLQRRLGVTTIYVTHDQTEAMTLGDRVGLMRRGSIVQIGAPEEIYDAPETAFAATFLGSPPMNLVPVRVARMGESVVADAGGVHITAGRRDRVHVDGNGEALLGVRPDRLRIGIGMLQSDFKGPALPGRVSAVEQTGREVLYHVELAAPEGCKVTVASGALGIGEGREILVGLRPEDVHLFPADLW